MDNNFDLDKLFNDIRYELCNVKDTDDLVDNKTKVEIEERCSEIENKMNENYSFLNSTLSNKIESEIRNMKSELSSTYDIFKNTAEVLEGIQFEKIRHRIKDLHMYPDDKDLEKLVTNAAMNKSDIREIGKFVEAKFRSHPGEFGDIPELNSFLTACNQMQHGMKELEDKRKKMTELRRKMDWANLVHTQKIESLKRATKKQGLAEGITVESLVQDEFETEKLNIN